MAGQREALAAAVATRFRVDGIAAETAAHLAQAVASRATFDALGLAVDLGTVVAAVKDENGEIFDMKPAPASQAEPQPRAGNVTDEAAAARARDAAAATARTDEIVSGLNPWSRNGWNITKQAFVMNHRPDIATKLMQAAGA